MSFVIHIAEIQIQELKVWFRRRFIQNIYIIIYWFSTIIIILLQLTAKLPGEDKTLMISYKNDKFNIIYWLWFCHWNNQANHKN